MTTFTIKASALLMIFFSLIGGALGQSKAAANANKAKVSSALLYKITGKGLKKPSYLYGTIHIICPTDIVGMDKLNGLIDQSDKLLMELDMDDPAVMTSMATALNMKGDKTIKDLYTPEQYQKIDELFKQYIGISVDPLNKMSPTGLAIVIATSPKAIGCAKPSSYDLTFMQNAVKNKKTIEGLESVDDEIAALSSVPLEKQAADFYKIVTDPQKGIDDFKTMIQIYKEQDSDKLFTLIKKQSGNDDQFQKNLLDDRNKKWIPKIEAALADSSIFIAVGAGHLGGKNGVVRLLRKKGYKLEPIKL